jgi:LmbE family N-acetylglucosaminyl deacetylase
MLGIIFNKEHDAPLNILCLGAHGDDIEIGCGGTILRLTQEYSNLNFSWIVFSCSQQRIDEAYTSADSFLRHTKNKHVHIQEYKDGYFPYIGAQIKDYFAQLKVEFFPDLIFTHYRQDLHQDHRLISELTWNTFRNHLILEYEVPKYDGDLGSPNFFVNIDEPTRNLKIEILLSHFKTQTNKHWFAADTFRSIMRLRGIESGSSSKYAEAFYVRKWCYHD